MFQLDLPAEYIVEHTKRQMCFKRALAVNIKNRTANNQLNALVMYFIQIGAAADAVQESITFYQISLKPPRYENQNVSII